jgi:hypothetical protein
MILERDGRQKKNVFSLTSKLKSFAKGIHCFCTTAKKQSKPKRKDKQIKFLLTFRMLRSCFTGGGSLEKRVKRGVTHVTLVKLENVKPGACTEKVRNKIGNLFFSSFKCACAFYGALEVKRFLNYKNE